MRNTSTATTTFGAAIVELLTAHHDVDTVFGIPGVHTIELYRGVVATGVRSIVPRHEQGAGFMADGYGRIAGKPDRFAELVGQAWHGWATGRPRPVHLAIPTDLLERTIAPIARTVPRDVGPRGRGPGRGRRGRRVAGRIERHRDPRRGWRPRRSRRGAGDGGSPFTLPELATAVDLGARLTLVLWDNAGHGEIRDSFDRAGAPRSGTETTAHDLVAIAAGFGCHAQRVDEPIAFATALAASFRRPGVSVVVATEPVCASHQTGDGG